MVPFFGGGGVGGGGLGGRGPECEIANAFFQFPRKRKPPGGG